MYKKPKLPKLIKSLWHNFSDPLVCEQALWSSRTLQRCPMYQDRNFYHGAKLAKGLILITSLAALKTMLHSLVAFVCGGVFIHY